MITKSIIRRNKKPDMQQPYLIPVIIGKRGCCLVVLSRRALEIIIQGVDHLNKFFGYFIFLHDNPKTVFVYQVESFLKVHKMDVHGSIPLVGLLQDVPEDENLINSPTLYRKLCLLFL